MTDPENGSVDLVYLVALASHTRPIVPVATVPGQVVIWTPGREGCCWPGGTVEQLQVIAASMAGSWPAHCRCG
ncbi:hypothetical protein OR604_18420 [Aeromonas caviae]|uniref:hypothetical protein n=1 Tax=Aeromonas caviae TaxID=648 RepID=UPI00225979CA|nr:hypothetical protein [Aeromonas caviae]MCX4038161.1 hypothetical protein [Aeromonas caviae]